MEDNIHLSSDNFGWVLSISFPAKASNLYWSTLWNFHYSFQCSQILTDQKCEFMVFKGMPWHVPLQSIIESVYFFKEQISNEKLFKVEL